MTTLATMTDQVLAEIASYVKNQESITAVTQPVTASATTIDLDDVKAVSKGTVEIGDELIYVKRTIPTSSQIVVIPGGRGWRGTTATTHAVNTLVRNNPVFPRVQVQRAINETIKGINLMVLANHSFNFTGVQYAYVLPTDVVDVTGVSWNPPDVTKVWPLLKRWRIDRNYYDENTQTTRTALVMHEAVQSGRDVRVQYVRYPTQMASASSTYASTGLPESAQDVVRLGAMWRLVSTIDPGKVVMSSPSGEIVDAQVGAGESTNISRYLFQLFQVRLTEERSKQEKNYLQTINYLR